MRETFLKLETIVLVAIPVIAAIIAATIATLVFGLPVVPAVLFGLDAAIIAGIIEDCCIND